MTPPGSVHPCPCSHPCTPMYVEPLSDSSTALHYYRCDHCGVVWHVPKNAPWSKLTVVTEAVPKPTDCGTPPQGNSF